MSAENVCTISPNLEECLLQRALDFLPRDGSPTVLRLAPGVYREKVVINRPNTTLEGAGADCTRIVWGDAAYTLLADGRKRGTFRTATLRTDAPGITLRGLTIENDAAPREAAGQAIALYADGDGLLCEDCRLLGAHIAPTGFHDWNKPAAHDTTFYAECGSFGPGASGERCAFSHALSRGEADALTPSFFLAHWRA